MATLIADPQYTVGLSKEEILIVRDALGKLSEDNSKGLYKFFLDLSNDEF